MPRIALVHAPRPLAQAFMDLGWDVAADLRPQGSELDIATALADAVPDLFLQVEILGPRLLLRGLEELPCPTLFWALDPHLNGFWQAAYGRLFDLTLSTQARWREDLTALGARRAPALVRPGPALAALGGALPRDLLRGPGHGPAPGPGLAPGLPHPALRGARPKARLGRELRPDARPLRRLPPGAQREHHGRAELPAVRGLLHGLPGPGPGPGPGAGGPIRAGPGHGGLRPRGRAQVPAGLPAEESPRGPGQGPGGLGALWSACPRARNLDADLAGSLGALRLEEWDMARGFWLARLKARQEPSKALLEPPADPRALLRLWARLLREEDRVQRPGFPFDPEVHVPDCAAECLLWALDLAPGDTELLREMDGLLASRPGLDQMRVGFLSELTLRQRQDWRLGLADLKCFRLEAGLEELAVALGQARAQGREQAFFRPLASRDPGGLLARSLA